MVIESYPRLEDGSPRLEDGSPFPTLYWLTCPVLAKRASALESTGWMQGLNSRLDHDGSLRARLADAIERYRETRDAHERIDDGGSVPGGGPERVKCVHAHLAHELAGGYNPVGALAMAAAGWPDCRAPCFGLTEPHSSAHHSRQKADD